MFTVKGMGRGKEGKWMKGQWLENTFNESFGFGTYMLYIKTRVPDPEHKAFRWKGCAVMMPWDRLATCPMAAGIRNRILRKSRKIQICFPCLQYAFICLSFLQFYNNKVTFQPSSFHTIDEFFLSALLPPVIFC